jgi:hypothetical protein
MEGGDMFCSSQWCTGKLPSAWRYRPVPGPLSIDGTVMELAPLRFRLLPYGFSRLMLCSANIEETAMGPYWETILTTALSRAN